MRDRQHCIDCDKQSPETETNYTLISAQFGWRLTRRKTDSGEFVIEWRCPECWRKHKAKSNDEAPSSTHHTVGDRFVGRVGSTRSSRPPPASSPKSSKPPTSLPVTTRKRP